MTSQNKPAPKHSRAPGVATSHDIAEATVWLWTKPGNLLIPIKPSLKATQWRVSDLDAHVTQ